MRRKTKPLLWVVAAFAVFITALWQQRADHAPASARPEASVPARQDAPVSPRRDAPARPQDAPSSRDESAPATRDDDAVPAGERVQLEKTLALIERGGPFPYPKDGTVFGNREGLLPPQPRGYYREYTVPTPGAKNRGARRVVRGKKGETWYTRDHYKSFVRIDE